MDDLNLSLFAILPLGENLVDNVEQDDYLICQPCTLVLDKLFGDINIYWVGMYVCGFLLLDNILVYVTTLAQSSGCT